MIGTNANNAHITSSDLRYEFAGALDRNKPANITEPFVMEIPSTDLIPVYAFWGATPKMREFVDERTRQNMYEYTASLGQKKWELTVDIGRDLLVYQRTSELRDKLNALAVGINDHRDVKVQEFLNACIAASGQTTHHKVNWEATPRSLTSRAAAPHVWGSSGNWANCLCTSANGAFSSANLVVACKRLAAVKDDQGNLMGKRATHIGFATNIADSVWEALNTPTKIQASYTGDIASYVMKLGLIPVELPLLTDGYWFVADCSGPQRPVAVVTNPNQPDEYVALTDPKDSSDVFERDVYTFGCRKVEDYWAGHPATIVGADGVA